MFDISSHFTVRDSGCLAISFDDPTFVRAEMVLFDRVNGRVEVLLHGKLHSVGQVPEELMRQFEENGRDVLLTAVRTDGSSLELSSKMLVLN